MLSDDARVTDGERIGTVIEDYNWNSDVTVKWDDGTDEIIDRSLLKDVENERDQKP